MSLLNFLLPSRPGVSSPSGPRNHRAYAVGDIHGRLDLLDEMLELIERDIGERRPLPTSIIFLGDLIDRGPSSAQVIERLRTYAFDGVTTVFLMGNHEEVMLRVIEGDAQLLERWLQFGGLECLKSYRVDLQELRRLTPDRAVQLVQRHIPRAHVEFVKSFSDTVTFGDYLFVHAGIRPNVPIGDQAQTDLRWIRDPFLSDNSRHEYVIVHGHTVSEDVEVHPNRIGIDTGAYATGLLSAVAIEGGRSWFLQTSGAMASTFPLNMSH